MSESLLMEYMTKLDPCDGIAFDIGANHGTYCEILSKRFRKVYAFEPHPVNLTSLRKNIEHLSNVEIVPKAISNVSGRIKMWPSSNHGGHSINENVGKREEWGHKYDETIEVDAITIDDFVHELQEAPTLIKMDIEGAENFVWQGATYTLTKHAVDIMLETHQTVELKALFNFFKGLGYNFYNETTDKLESINHDTHYHIYKG